MSKVEGSPIDRPPLPSSVCVTHFFEASRVNLNENLLTSTSIICCFKFTGSRFQKLIFTVICGASNVTTV